MLCTVALQQNTDGPCVGRTCATEIGFTVPNDDLRHATRAFALTTATAFTGHHEQDHHATG